ncbi:histidine kinase [Streptomyces sp. NBC_00237]|uniref:sensor histidine kinase n=1 Tax=Streptomyces sp. NBC_00237 TaxID=2975687 RepID=UPI00225005DB|nr:histidine kinase [Streptomyces sp. NBC_00237]MCX5204515.1 histidine kinase [Streptomyces sp. NBC_00237]
MTQPSCAARVLTKASSPARRRLRTLLLPFVAFGGAFFPAALPGPYGPAWPVLDAVPGPVAASAVGLLAAVAVRTWPERPWLLFLIAGVDCVVRSPGLLVSVASYVAATSYRRPRHLVLFTSAASLLVAVPRPGVEAVSALGGVALFVWLPVVGGLWRGARAQVVAGLRERAERLEREQSVRTEQARAQERARIARDMHDVVAHRVSLMVLRAGALEISAADERTAQEAELIRTTGKEALAQLRSVLGVLTEAGTTEPFLPQPTLADLERLLEQSRSAGVPVERQDEGTARDLPAMVEHTAYRVVQEALTNVHKHAVRPTVRVAVRHLPSALEVTVTNTAAHVPAPPLPGSGLGLVGLRERVELLGGRFAAGPGPSGGFAVTARLPT